MTSTIKSSVVRRGLLASASLPKHPESEFLLVSPSSLVLRGTQVVRTTAMVRTFLTRPGVAAVAVAQPRYLPTPPLIARELAEVAMNAELSTTGSRTAHILGDTR